MSCLWTVQGDVVCNRHVGANYGGGIVGVEGIEGFFNPAPSNATPAVAAKAPAVAATAPKATTPLITSGPTFMTTIASKTQTTVVVNNIGNHAFFTGFNMIRITDNGINYLAEIKEVKKGTAANTVTITIKTNLSNFTPVPNKLYTFHLLKMTQ